MALARAFTSCSAAIAVLDWPNEARHAKWPQLRTCRMPSWLPRDCYPTAKARCVQLATCGGKSCLLLLPLLLPPPLLARRMASPALAHMAAECPIPSCQRLGATMQDVQALHGERVIVTSSVHGKQMANGTAQDGPSRGPAPRRSRPHGGAVQPDNESTAPRSRRCEVSQSKPQECAPLVPPARLSDASAWRMGGGDGGMP